MLVYTINCEQEFHIKHCNHNRAIRTVTYDSSGNNVEMLAGGLSGKLVFLTAGMNKKEHNTEFQILNGSLLRKIVLFPSSYMAFFAHK